MDDLVAEEIRLSWGKTQIWVKEKYDIPKLSESFGYVVSSRNVPHDQSHERIVSIFIYDTAKINILLKPKANGTGTKWISRNSDRIETETESSGCHTAEASGFGRLSRAWTVLARSWIARSSSISAAEQMYRWKRKWKWNQERKMKVKFQPITKMVFSRDDGRGFP